MRCLNCSTVLMASDTVCPVCHMATGSASSQGQSASAARDRQAGLIGAWLIRHPRFAKFVAAPLVLLVGVLMMLACLAMVFEARDEASKGPKVVTAAELKTTKPSPLIVEEWITYTAPQKIETGIQLERTSLGHRGEVKCRYVLVQVEDKWMIAAMAKDDSSDKLVGRVLDLGSPMSQDLVKRIVAKFPDKTKSLMDNEFYAAEGFERKTRTTYLMAGLLGFFGFMFAILGLTTMLARKQQV